ncbi:MAG: SusC/RagA family TonB-linked outer membrane protein, partial [Bacteroidales bacterium]|nr:SusC/RagA family TonB-linked outer membrane protein [Bacteroidales bacterium]
MNQIKYILIILLLGIIGVHISAQQADNDTLNYVTGSVFDGESMLPMEIVTVNNGTFSSTFTELDGTFSIKVKSPNDVLVVSAFGYRKKEVVLSGRKEVNVYMYPVGYKSFSENVILNDFTKPLAYSSRSVSIMTNNSSFYKADRLGATSGEAFLKGNIAGLDVVSRDGNVGSGSDLFLRGYSSLNATNRPLVVLDGMIYDINEYGNPLINNNRYNAFASIDPNDIENITVIKDATSTYGAKAANGVIFISTSHANEQVNKISFNMSGGLNFSPEGLPLLDAGDYRLFLNEMYLSKGLTQDSIMSSPFFNYDENSAEYLKYHNNTDWQKEIFTNSFSSNYGLQINGGDDVALYSLSVNYNKYNGTVKNTDFSRFGMRFNSDVNISKVISLNSNISFAYDDRNLKNGSGYTSSDNLLYSSYIKTPLFNPYQVDNNIVTPVLADYDLFGVSNPVAMSNEMDQVAMNSKIFGSFNFNAKINDHLVVSNLVGLSYSKNREKIFIPGYGIAPDTTEIGIVTNKMKERILRHSTVNNDFRVRYINLFNDMHEFSAVAGSRLNFNSTEEDWGSESNSANDQLRTIGQGTARFRTNGGFLGDWNSITYYLSADYNYLKKYFISVNASLDGNSKFGSEADGISLHGHQFGFFPSLSGAWLLTSEPFMSSVSFVNLLKLRTSYGVTGNDDIGFNGTEKFYTSQKNLAAEGLIRANLWNPALKWETITKFDAGLDMALFNERLFVSADYYQNNTEDMLEFKPEQFYTGFDYVLANNGSLETTGYDVTMNSRVLNGKIKWDLGIVLSHFDTKVTAIADGQNMNVLYGANILTKVGQPIAQFYGYKTIGVYATQQQADDAGLVALLSNTSTLPFQAGDVIFEDSHQDGVIDEQDMQVIGNPAPDFTG